MTRALRTSLGVGLWLLAGCADSIIKTLGEENAPVTQSAPGELRFEAFELDNVHDEVEVRWENPAPRATVLHRSLVHHGQVMVTVLDAVGTQLYSAPVEYDLDTETEAGQPGSWTVRIQFFGARGRVDVALTALADDG